MLIQYSAELVANAGLCGKSWSAAACGLWLAMTYCTTCYEKHTTCQIRTILLGHWRVRYEIALPNHTIPKVSHANVVLRYYVLRQISHLY